MKAIHNGIKSGEHEFKIGDLVRSFDFMGRETEGERACYVDGVIEKIAPFEGCGPNCDHYYICCTRRVFGGKEESSDIGRIFYPAVNYNFIEPKS